MSYTVTYDSAVQEDASIDYSSGTYEDLDKTSGGDPIQVDFTISSLNDVVNLLFEASPWNSANNDVADIRIIIDGTIIVTGGRFAFRDTQDAPYNLKGITRGLSAGDHYARVQIKCTGTLDVRIPHDAANKPCRLSYLLYKQS